MAAARAEGPVHHYVVRHLSEPLARLLEPTPLVPSHVSLAGFLVALGSLAAFALGQPIVAGILILGTLAVEGVRASLGHVQGGTDRFGGVFHGVLNRYADGAIIGGMTWWAWSHTELSGPEPLVAGIATLTAFLLVSYTRARLETEGYGHLLGGPDLVASRDVRLFVLGLGSLAGATYWAMVATGGVSGLVVAWRVWLVYRHPQQNAGPAEA